jgi:hypothetical protein
VGVERGLKVNPKELSSLTFPSREDVHNEMVSIEEPLSTEDIEDIEQWKVHSTILSIAGLRHRRGLRRLAGSRRRRGSHLCLLRGWGEAREGQQVDTNIEMMVVKGQEGLKYRGVNVVEERQRWA